MIAYDLATLLIIVFAGNVAIMVRLSNQRGERFPRRMK